MDLFLVLYIFTVAITALFIDMNNLVKPKISFFWCFLSIFTVVSLLLRKNKMIVNNSLEFIDECS